MTVGTAQQARIVRWHGGQHPTQENISLRLKEEGLRPYVWVSTPNFRYPSRSHGTAKTIFCVQGSLEVTFTEAMQRVTLRSGDRVDVPRRVRYSVIVGPSGAQCIEGAPE